MLLATRLVMLFSACCQPGRDASEEETGAVVLQTSSFEASGQIARLGFPNAADKSAADPLLEAPVAETIDVEEAGRKGGATRRRRPSFKARRPEPIQIAALQSISPSEAFEAPLRLEKPGGADLGLVLAYSTPSALYVASVADDGPDTAVGRYNAGSSKELRICAGDYIVGMGGAPPSASSMSGRGTLGVIVLRPEVLRSSVTKRGRSLGIQLRYEEEGEGAGLLVTVIRPTGAVALDGADVRVGDRILEVNNCEGPPAVLLEALAAADHAELKISRPSASFA